MAKPVRPAKIKPMKEPKRDCFAFREGYIDGNLYAKGGECAALNELYCRKEKCAFYKPKGTERDISRK